MCIYIYYKCVCNYIYLCVYIYVQSLGTFGALKQCMLQTKSGRVNSLLSIAVEDHQILVNPHVLLSQMLL